MALRGRARWWHTTASQCIPALDTPGVKILIIGGCDECPAPPYYTGLAALKTGVGSVTVLCTREAARIVKSLTPELSVLALLPATNDPVRDVDTPMYAQLQRTDAVVIGPGLGRDPVTLQAATRAIEFATRLRVPTVVDGPALYLLCQNTKLLVEHPYVVLTPNPSEYSALWTATSPRHSLSAASVGEGGCSSGQPRHRQHIQSTSPQGSTQAVLPPDPIGPVPAEHPKRAPTAPVRDEQQLHDAESPRPQTATGTALLARRFGTGVCVLQKGRADVIAGGGDPPASAYLTEPVSPKHCSGQGDILCGIVTAFLAWARRANMLPVLHSASPFASAVLHSASLQRPPPSVSLILSPAGAGFAVSSEGSGGGGDDPSDSAVAAAAEAVAPTSSDERWQLVDPRASLATATSTTAAAAATRETPSTVRASAPLSVEAFEDAGSVHPAPAVAPTHARVFSTGTPYPAVLVACASGGVTVLRHAAALAFKRHRRAMTAPDIIAFIGMGFEEAFSS